LPTLKFNIEHKRRGEILVLSSSDVPWFWQKSKKRTMLHWFIFWFGGWCGVVFVCVYSIDITSIMSDTQSNKYLQNCNPHIMNSFKEEIGKRKREKGRSS